METQSCDVIICLTVKITINLITHTTAIIVIVPTSAEAMLDNSLEIFSEIFFG